MKLLGAVLAGGRSSRFGADKAETVWRGKALVDHALSQMREQCDTVVLCGRRRNGVTSLADRPTADEGPLGGLNAALAHAMENGFDAVLSIACDNARIPADLADRLSPGPAYAESQPVIGLWPVALAPRLDAWLADQPRRAMMAWVEHIGAAPVALPEPPPNINTPDDLRALADRAGDA
ncbi:molybdenum cofactor guanylyltransferase [Parasphingopyxis algicola]|uniref:molybdenum cofactor guanylyltransferase n=1 Tax=Parasphingopyxis algicola TaxID=2026624 RepID=UPI0015A0D2B3|nr:molybdenum cofactor guanylyltransferase [Parasphingopyxis algicola]QLC26545.1 molybdenum cofactor guanylyltransferase [Parasphingopyxis algicola]